MAIQQGDKRLYYPKADTILHSGDKLLVIGEPEEVAALRELIKES
ncbi:MAG: hypothetical protein F6J86_47595, partial [Symploca sp. SIO1B1]|nr:hypothetical protein [Symploca sp. SIO1B1]